MKFKSNIESQAGIEDSAGSAGDLGQILSSLGSVAGVDGIGWIDQADVVAAGATRVLIACKNTSGATITKGTPVYQTGNVGATDVIEIAEADALISTGYLPAIGLLEIDLINNALGHVVITGELLNYSTADIPTDRPGGDPFTGDTVYLAAGGGLTCIKPTGAGNAIQNLGLVGKVSVGNAGSLTVASIMRANDVPNLPEGRILIGDGNTIVSDTVYVDEPNGRVGIGTTSPYAKLHVASANGSDTPTAGTATGGLFVSNTNKTYGINMGVSGSGWSFIQSQRADGDTTLYSLNLQPLGGNVGIGTTSPQAKLHVANGILRTWTPALGTSAIFESTVSNRNFVTITGAAEAELWFGNGSVQTKGRIRYEMAGNNMEFWTNATQKMVIDGDGYVGVGTDSPNRLLTVETTGSGCYLALNSSSNNTTIGSDVNGAFIVYDDSSSTYRMVIDQTTGNVGIGTTSPNAKLEVAGSTRITGNGLDVGYANNGTNFIQIGNGRTTNGYAYIDLVGDSTYSDYGLRIIRNNLGANTSTEMIHRGTGNFNFNATQAANIAFRTQNIERLRIDSTGNVGIGTIGPSQKLHVVGRVASTAGNGFQIINSYGSPLLSDFYGSFTTSSSLYIGGPFGGQACYASAFNITSDYRLKENETPLTEASSRIKKLKPIRFNYISSENTVDGFLAHEVAEVIPEAVTGEKDAVREDGSDELQGLDLSKIVPLLTAALQESITKIEQLEQRIQTLENK